MGYVDKADRMTNSYSISRRTWKWTNKLFFHLLDLTIFNSFILLSCGAKLSHRDFRLALVCNMLEHAATCCNMLQGVHLDHDTLWVDPLLSQLQYLTWMRPVAIIGQRPQARECYVMCAPHVEKNEA
jgi:hypothetical protein